MPPVGLHAFARPPPFVFVCYLNVIFNHVATPAMPRINLIDAELTRQGERCIYLPQQGLMRKRERYIYYIHAA